MADLPVIDSGLPPVPPDTSNQTVLTPKTQALATTAGGERGEESASENTAVSNTGTALGGGPPIRFRICEEALELLPDEPGKWGEQKPHEHQVSKGGTYPSPLELDRRNQHAGVHEKDPGNARWRRQLHLPEPGKLVYRPGGTNSVP